MIQYILQAAKEVLGTSDGITVKFDDDSWVILDSDGQEVQNDRYDEIQILADELQIKDSVPSFVTRMQLLSALVAMEFITPQEAIEANTTIPSGVLNVISSLSEQEQIFAKIKWLNFTEAYRDDSLVQALIASKQMTEQETDEFFLLAGSL